MRHTHRTSPRLTALLAGVLLGLCALAAQAAQLSPSVVLVLKLVAADRVQPVTGVVVSNDGLVLVPAEFVAEEAEIIVLDGGTDIIAHGRHAEVVASDETSGLAILAAEGLWRPGITLSATDPHEDDSLHLEAFPPARQIAEGSPPLQVTLDQETPLPYVTGAILDACGLLSGLSVAKGTQSLESTQRPQRIGRESLTAALEQLQIDMPRAGCAVVHEVIEDATRQPDPALVVTETSVTHADTAQPRAQAPAGQLPGATQPPGPEPAQSTVERTPRSRTTPVTPGTPVTIELAEDSAPESPQEDQPAESLAPVVPDAAPAWLLPAVALVLVLLAWRYAIANRNRRNAGGAPVQPASDEPATVRLAADANDAEPVMRSGRGVSEGLPAADDLPGGCNGLVILESAVGAAGESQAFCAVDLEGFEIVIGRGGADLDISHPAVSRQHARIKGGNGHLSIEDLGSSNGTYIDRVPCLPGEIMHLRAGAEIWLGELCCHIRLLDEAQLA